MVKIPKILLIDETHQLRAPLSYLMDMLGYLSNYQKLLDRTCYEGIPYSAVLSYIDLYKRCPRIQAQCLNSRNLAHPELVPQWLRWKWTFVTMPQMTCYRASSELDVDKFASKWQYCEDSEMGVCKILSGPGIWHVHGILSYHDVYSKASRVYLSSLLSSIVK